MQKIRLQNTTEFRGTKFQGRGGGSSEMEHAREKSRRKEGKKNLQHSSQKTDIIYWNIKHVAGEGTSHKYEGIQSESFRVGKMAQGFRAIAVLGTRVQYPAHFFRSSQMPGSLAPKDLAPSSDSSGDLHMCADSQTHKISFTQTPRK